MPGTPVSGRIARQPTTQNGNANDFPFDRIEYHSEARYPDNEMNRKQIFAALFGVIVVVLATSSLLFERRARVEAAGTHAPRFEVDPMWPKPLPHHWVMGSVIGVSVDASDHIWV